MGVAKKKRTRVKVRRHARKKSHKKVPAQLGVDERVHRLWDAAKSVTENYKMLGLSTGFEIDPETAKTEKQKSVLSSVRLKIGEDGAAVLSEESEDDDSLQLREETEEQKKEQSPVCRTLFSS